ncbi:transglycosylase SLT domain-containing protein [Wenzhouxiangella sp. XN201]|uniref:transglycosylase SLT domain-containing protein n=1 Tax=Wenzhouxiangella sp. XN201 TaxID=2710755 RepID=UPI0013CB3AA4|nr:transglycosylase SLT domain-containing protein [Wenzhouxiangella sp. XN201]NEZ04423.1 transglycosylase SLT domain-containing protein [Wenzhouxiangella sp. XN201]
MKASVKQALAAILVVLAWSATAMADRPSERETFRSGWAAAERGDQAGIVRAISQLPDYPLTPYLQFELFRQRIDRVPTAVVTQFLARHRDWSFSPALERAWLRSLGENDRFDLLIEHGGESRDVEVRCHLARARIERGQTEGLAEDVLELWLAGRSQPDACDPVFAWWRRQGHLDAEAAWQRFRLTIDAGELRLARYLKRYLPESAQPWADRWLSMASGIPTTLRDARRWSDLEEARNLVSWGLMRLARRDWAMAQDHWEALSGSFDWSESERTPIEREIALFRAVALDGDALSAIDALSESGRDEQMLAWRARAAMAEGEWREVLASIEAMPLREQGRSRWRYWRGRALAELGRPDALIAFSSLSAEADYYGFLAASLMGQSLVICPETIQPDAAIQRRLLRDAEFERVLELFHVGLPWHGRSTWRHLSQRLIAREFEQAALIAAGQGWHHLAITALNQTGRRQAYSWRFPMAAKGTVLAEARRHGVDPALVYGLMRAESAMQADARSSAGAMGLLQLMPTTAQAVARRQGLQWRGAGSLHDPETNVPLGVAHLAELQEEFDGDWVRVAAAYNAGRNAVRRWLDERPALAPDVWIETLPYYETRDYVPRVLAFATIYEWQLERQPGLLPGQVLPGQPAPSGFACPP